MVLLYLVKLFVVFVQGRWSDTSSRRFVLIICLLMSAAGYIVMGFAQTVLLLLLSRIPLGEKKKIIVL